MASRRDAATFRSSRQPSMLFSVVGRQRIELWTDFAKLILAAAYEALPLTKRHCWLPSSSRHALASTLFTSNCWVAACLATMTFGFWAQSKERS